jgi:hypothetical protein
MALRRATITGPPHTYYLTARSSWGRDCLREREDRQGFLDLVELLRQAFDLRLYAYALQPDAYHLVLRHRADFPEDHDHLVRRWQLLGGGTPPLDRLQQRLTSLSGLMQTLAQRSSRAWHRRNGGRGPLWAERYRACLLADDAALLAAVAWVETVPSRELPPAATSRDQPRTSSALPQLAPLPLRSTPDGEIFPADETPLDLPPPPPQEAERLFRRFSASLGSAVIETYGQALLQGWSLGRPESLTEPLARLGRSQGRGRSRQLRELDDDFGLCGVWG